jgi:hypothetical protein
MHNFGQITCGHVSPLFIIELLHKKGKERLTKFGIHNKDGSTNGSGMQMELECKWNFNFE